MTFSELVDAVEKQRPGGIYSITVEFSQYKQHQSCAHIPATKREMEFKIWDGKEFYEGPDAKSAFQKFAASLVAAVAPAPEPLMVDAENVNTEVQF